MATSAADAVSDQSRAGAGTVSSDAGQSASGAGSTTREGRVDTSAVETRVDFDVSTEERLRAGGAAHDRVVDSGNLATLADERHYKAALRAEEIQSMIQARRQQDAQFEQRMAHGNFLLFGINSALGDLLVKEVAAAAGPAVADAFAKMIAAQASK